MKRSQARRRSTGVAAAPTLESCVARHRGIKARGDVAQGQPLGRRSTVRPVGASERLRTTWFRTRPCCRKSLITEPVRQAGGELGEARLTVARLMVRDSLLPEDSHADFSDSP